MKIFNLVFDSGKIPKQWVQGMIKPVYKNKGDKRNPKNYRPITIVSCFGKVFTAVLNERLKRFSEQTSLLKENQNGFREKYSTIDCAFLLNSLIEVLQHSKKKLFCAFVDFEKAFDTVNRNFYGLKC